MQKRRYQPSFFCADFLNTFCCFWHKHVFCKLFPFLFRCYAHPKKTMRKQGDCNQNFNTCIYLVLCLPEFVFLAQKRVLQIVFFVWLPCGCSQLCVCKVLSDICCFRHLGTLLRRHFAFLTMHFCCFTTQQIRFSVFACVFNLSTAKNCVCSFLCFSKHLCVAKTFCVLFGIGQNFFAGQRQFLQCVATFGIQRTRKT